MASLNIAIIGGGIAGLNCAYQLAKAGADAVVYEASGRVGGRIWTDRDGNGTSFERGGEFINEEHLDIQALCQELNVPLYQIYREGQVAPRVGYMDGTTLRSELDFAIAVQPLVHRLQDDLARLQSEDNGPYLGRLDRLTAAEYLEGTKLPDWAMEHVRIFLVSEMGRELAQLSALNVFSLVEVTPETPWIVPPGYARYIVEGGTERIIQGLAERIEGRIETDRRLAALRESGSRYRLHFDGRAEEVDADWVVLATPFTALRRADLSGVTLSLRKRRAINELQYATNSKVIIPYRGCVREARPDLSDVVSDSLRAFVWESSRYTRGGFCSLTVYRGGESGARTSDASVAAVRNEIIAALDDAYPGSARDQSGDLIAVEWQDGSYSCPGPGQQTAFDDALGTPEGRLLFCGEHTSKSARCYMSGAAASGVAAAEYILTSLQLPTDRLTRPASYTSTPRL